MKFDREELLQVLDVAKLAIDQREFIPILSHFCFHGRSVTAYNDFIGVQVQCKTNFALALQANTLLRLLNSVHSKEVEIGVADKLVFFRSGKPRTGVRARLPFMSEKDFFFKWPALKRLSSAEMPKKVAAKFFKGIELCLSSVGDQMPAQMGVTLNEAGKFLCMYSTNNKAISKFRMAALGVTAKNIIIPTIFCKAVLKAADVYGRDDVVFYTAKDFVIAKFGKECLVYGKLVNNKDPLDFEKVIKEHLSAEYKNEKQKLAEGFAEGFQRALLILDSDLSKLVTVELDRNTVSIEAKSPLGKLKSGSRFANTWPRKTFRVDAELAARAVESATDVYFGKRVIVFSKPAYTHLLMCDE